MKKNWFTYTGLQASFLALAVMITAPFPSLAERPGADHLHVGALNAEKNDALLETTEFLDTFWQAGWGSDFVLGKSSMFLRETAVPGYWDVLLSDSATATEEVLWADDGLFDEAQRFDLEPAFLARSQCIQYETGLYDDLSAYVTAGTIFGSTGTDLRVWGLVVSGVGFLDADGSELRVFVPGGMADGLEEVVRSAREFAGLERLPIEGLEASELGDLTAPYEKSNCQHCITTYHLELQVCETDFIECLDDGSDEAVLCAIVCAGVCVASKSAPICTLCLIGCLILAVGFKPVCESKRANCQSRALLKAQTCLNDCYANP